MHGPEVDSLFRFKIDRIDIRHPEMRTGEEGAAMKKICAMVSILLGVVLFFVRTGAAVENQVTDPIDKFLAECESKDPSTLGQNRCIEQAEKMWDKELNKVYADLMDRLKPKERQLLKQSQLLWIKHRDSERELLDGVYSYLSGTMYQPWHAFDSMNLVKSRVLLLRKHLELIKDFAGPDAE